MIKCPVCGKIAICDCSVFDLMSSALVESYKPNFEYMSAEMQLRDLIEQSDADFDEGNSPYGE